MKKLFLFVALAGVAWANQAVEGFCEQGNIAVQTSGLPSTNVVQGSFPSCTVSVFTAGTTNLISIFSDNMGTTLSNPFTANTSGRWLFYAANQRVDIQLSGGGLPAPWSIKDIIITDSANPITFGGNNTFTGTNAFNGTSNNFGRLNAVRNAYAGSIFDTQGACAGEMGCVINNAIKDIPDTTPEGIIIYAFGGGTISTNPFATIGNRSGIIYFGPAVWTTNVQLQLPKAWQAQGFGRGGISDGKNTIIKAGSSFPTSTPVFQMGINPVDDGVQIRNLGIDCQNISGVSAIQNQFSQEQAIVEHVLMVNCPGGALSVSGQAQNSGPYSDIEVLNFSCSNCAAGTVPVSIGSVTSFRGIRGATINSAGATLPTVALRIDAPGTYSDIHIESAVSSVIIGSQTATNTAVLANIECGPNITDCVKISNAFGTQNISLLGITATTGNIVTDQILGNTLTVAGEGNSVGMYVTGNGSPPSVLTSSVTTGDIFGAQTFWKERAAPSASAGYDACYGDSTAHSLKCSYNNGTFFNVLLDAASQTLTNKTISNSIIASSVNGMTTAGQSVSVVPCATSQRTETAADANLLTCAIPAQAGSYRIRFTLFASAANAATLGWTMTWHDSNGGVQAPTNLPLFNDTINGGSGVAAPALTFTTSVVSSYHGSIDIDTDNSATSIVVKLSFSGTSFTAKASATVERII